MAVVAGLVVGGLAAGASAYGAVASANAQQQASQTAANSQNNANRLNYQMFQQAHGSNGNAVLPDYMGGFEKQLGNDLSGAYTSAAVPLTTFQAATGRLAPAEQGAVNTTNSIFNGGITRTLLNNAAPVQATRLAVARDSSLDALHQTLDQIDASQAQRGMVGDSYANRLLQFQAGQTAGNAVGAATLQNQQETADINNYGNVTLPLQNLVTPYTQGQQAGQFAFLPQDEWLQSMGQRMQPLNMVKIGYTGPFQYQPLPTPGPGAYSGVANALSSLGGSGSGMSGAALNYYMQQQNQQAQQNLLGQFMQQNAYNQSMLPQVQAANAATNQFNAAVANGADTGLWTGGAGQGGPTADESDFLSSYGY